MMENEILQELKLLRAEMQQGFASIVAEQEIQKGETEKIKESLETKIEKGFSDAKIDRQNLRDLIIEQKSENYDLTKRVEILEGQQSKS